MTTFTLYEGQDSNDNDRVRNFRKLDRALAEFKKSRYVYAVIHEYNGEDYVNTKAEKGLHHCVAGCGADGHIAKAQEVA